VKMYRVGGTGGPRWEGYRLPLQNGYRICEGLGYLDLDLSRLSIERSRWVTLFKSRILTADFPSISTVNVREFRWSGRPYGNPRCFNSPDHDCDIMVGNFAARYAKVARRTVHETCNLYARQARTPRSFSHSGSVSG